MTDADLRDLFVSEARSIVDALGGTLLALEREGAGGPAQVEAFRHFHTLKGMANMEGLPGVSRLCHEAETLLAEGATPPADRLLRILDQVDGLMRHHEEEHVAARRGAEATFVPVNVARLDDLLNLSGELAVAVTRLDYEHRELAGGPTDETIGRVSLLVRSLQDEVMRARLLPAKTLFATLPRLVRDAARAHGKEARLVAEEADIGMDRAIVDRMTGVLAHLVQNALVHGIEPPGERLRQGKPREGRVVARAYRDNETAVLEIEDDGRGVDVEAVKRRAVERGLLTRQEADALAEPAALEILFRPGFSTEEQADEHAGRGIGLTAAREAVRALGGTLALDARPGRGTRVTLRLPPTVALLDTLVVEAEGALLALALRNVRRIVPMAASMELAGRCALPYDGRALPVFAPDGSLAACGAQGFVVVAEGTGGRFGLAVDRLVGTHTAILKPLDSSTMRADSAAMGAAVLGSGSLAIVLDPNTYAGVS